VVDRTSTGFVSEFRY